MVRSAAMNLARTAIKSKAAAQLEALRVNRLPEVEAIQRFVCRE
jgi:hypothetical protein